MSSLSSSAHINTTNKSSNLPLPSISHRNDRPRIDLNANQAELNNVCQPRPPIHSSQRKNKIDDGVSIAQQSMTDIISRPKVPPVVAVATSEPKQQTKTQKLTLFNKVYEPSKSSAEEYSETDESDEKQISFIKPKEKVSSIFKIDKDCTRAKSKLANILSCLSDDYVESNDEIDNNSTVKSIDVPISTSASLSSGQTNVTFSTATTTSVLNIVNTSNQPIVQTTAPTFEITEKDKVNSKPEKSFVTISTATNSITNVSLTTTMVSSATSIASVVASSSTLDTSIASSPPKIGGFSFVSTSTVNTQPIVASSEEKSSSAPKFSFGSNTSTASQPTESSVPKPATGGFTFGQTNKTGKLKMSQNL